MVSIMEVTFVMFFVVYRTLTNSEEGGNLWVIFSYARDMYQTAATCSKI
jgi:hypothetical protein